MSSTSTGYFEDAWTVLSHPIGSLESIAGDSTSSVDLNVSNYATGHLTAEQAQQIQQQTYNQVLQAGGTQQEAQAAASEVQTYIANNGGTQDLSLPSPGTLFGLSAGVIIILVLVLLVLHEF